MNFEEFINSPQIKNAISSKDPYGELEKLFGNNPFAKNVINIAKRIPNNKQLETIANNVCKESNIDLNNLSKQINNLGK